jgi:hypothetical protein
MRREVPVTLRVPADLKERIDVLATEVGISSSAVWKILLHRSIKPILDGESLQALDIFEAGANLPEGVRTTAGPGKLPGLDFDRSGALRNGLLRKPPPR